MSSEFLFHTRTTKWSVGDSFMREFSHGYSSIKKHTQEYRRNRIVFVSFQKISPFPILKQQHIREDCVGRLFVGFPINSADWVICQLWQSIGESLLRWWCEILILIREWMGGSDINRTEKKRAECSFLGFILSAYLFREKWGHGRCTQYRSLK